MPILVVRGKSPHISEWWALDTHFAAPGRIPADSKGRTLIGSLVFEAKFRGDSCSAFRLAGRATRALACLPQWSRALHATKLVTLPVSHQNHLVIDALAHAAVELPGIMRASINMTWRGAPPNPTVKNLAPALRPAAVSGALTCPRLDNEVVLLIDDLLQTGSTVREAARTLKDRGSKEVIVLVATHCPIQAQQ